MGNSILISKSMLPAIYNGEIIVGNFFIYLLLLGFIIFPLVVFFITRYFKKKMALNQENLFGKIRLLEEQNKFLIKEQNARSSELTVLKGQIAEVENKLNQWIAEKSDLEKEIKSIKDQLQHSRKNNDIIIEYYMNENSGN